MKKRVYFALFVICAFFCGASVYALGDVPHNVSESANSIVRITVTNSFGTEEFSGIVISKTKDAQYILTSKHGIDGYNGDIIVEKGSKYKVKVSEVTAESADADLAVLKLSKIIPGTKTTEFKKRDMKEGSSVYTLGYDSDKDVNNIGDGVINTQSIFTVAGGKRDISVYFVSADVNTRNNGGALVDKNGYVVGVILYDGNKAQNKAVMNNEVFSFMDENDVSYRKATIWLLAIKISAVVLAVVAIGFLLLKKRKDRKATMPSIVGISGECAGNIYTLESGSINIGRDSKNCQIVLINDPKVSRCHCSVGYDRIRKLFAVTDLSSMHGTYINGERLDPKTPRFVDSGAVLKIGDGNTVFRVEIGGEVG